jgi:hypothetical protein
MTESAATTNCLGGRFIHLVHGEQQVYSGVTTRINEDSDRLSPGICYITPFDASCVVQASQVSPIAKINLDGSRTSLMLFVSLGRLLVFACPRWAPHGQVRCTTCRKSHRLPRPVRPIDSSVFCCYLLCEGAA